MLYLSCTNNTLHAFHLAYSISISDDLNSIVLFLMPMDVVECTIWIPCQVYNFISLIHYGVICSKKCLIYASISCQAEDRKP